MVNTIFPVQNASPKNEVRDMSINQIFNSNIDGVKCTDYQIKIYKVSDNTLLFDTTKLHLSTPLSDGELLNHTIIGGTIANSSTESYKWSVEVWNGAESVTSREFQFTAKTTPVLIFTFDSPIVTQAYTFEATVAQAEGDIVNNYTFDLYDSNQRFIESSGKITSFNISYEFEGFVNGDNLYIRLYGNTTGNQPFDSGLQSVVVTYSSPRIDMRLDAQVDNNTSLITLTRPEVVQIPGVGTGDISYTDNIFTSGDEVLKLGDASSNVEFDVAIPLDFSVKFKWKPISNSFEGIICDLGDMSYKFGYTGGRFYYDINGVVNYSKQIDIAGTLFYIVLLPTVALFKYKVLYTQVEDLSGIIDSYSGDTIDDISYTD